jgi:hypothetical protein
MKFTMSLARFIGCALAAERRVAAQMNLLFSFLVVLLAFTVSANAAEKAPTGIWLDDTSMSEMKLPASGDIPDLLDDFEYDENEILKAYVSDLNGDGAEDFLVESSKRLCGTGGCLYTLIEGKAKKRVGDFFGSPILILDSKINGYPVVQSYGHLSAESGSFATYVFDGKRYQIVSNISVSGKSLEELFKSFQAFRRIKAEQKKDS